MVGPAFVVVAYLMGSVCFGLVVAAHHGVDLRGTGSGNVGATNVGRLLGRRTGRLVLVLDAAKGLLPTLGAHMLLGRQDPWTAATGLAASLGHCYPIWFRFKGGKAAATAAGALLAVTPGAGAAAIATYVGLKKWTRRASVGSLAGGLIGALVSAALDGPRATSTQMAVALWVLLLWRHRDNLRRLARGEEPPS